MTLVHTIEHELLYRYDRPVRGSVMTLFVSPLVDQHQALQRFSLETDPGGAVLEFLDPYGNRGHFFDRPRTHSRLRIVARSRVAVDRSAPLRDTTEPGARSIGGDAPGAFERLLMLRPSRFVVPSSDALTRFISANGIAPGSDTLASLRTLQSSLYEIFEYVPGSTAADSPIDRILETGCGVCQDYSHVMASISRRWGIPARYVSGYLAPGPENAAAGESHAWVECWLPELGWTGFDPTNDCECDDRHVRVAVGRDYADVPPSRGVFSGLATSVLTAQVTVASHETGSASDSDSGLHNNTFSRSRESCDPATDPSPSAPSSGSPRSSQSLSLQSRPARSPLRSAPMSSAAMSGAAPISASRWRSSPG